MPRLHVQRICVHDRSVLPNVLVIDTSAILRWLAPSLPRGAELVGPLGLAPLFEARARSTRRVLWLVGPPELTDGYVTPQQLDQVVRAVAGNFEEDRIVSCGIRAAIVLERCPENYKHQLGLITADVEAGMSPTDLFCLQGWVLSVLDVATGQIWDAPRAVKKFGQPSTYGVRAALHELHLVGERKAAVVADSIGLGLDYPHEVPRQVADMEIAATTQARVREGQAEIERLQLQLVGEVDAAGNETRDPEAEVRASGFVVTPPSVRGTPGTAYVTARILRHGDQLDVVHLLAELNGHHWVALDNHDAVEVLATLSKLSPDRWFCSQALELLDFMADRKLRMPAAAFDVGLGVFVLDPRREPPDLVETCNHVEPLGRLDDGQLKWLLDVKRRTPAPLDIHEVADALPAIEGELRRLWEKHALDRLVDRDLSATLPILARMERSVAVVGVPDGFASWEAVRDAVEQRRDECHASLLELDRLRNVDFYADWTTGFLSWVETSAGISADLRFRPKERLARYVASGFRWAASLQELRTIGFATMPWLDRLAGPGEIRLRYFPLTTGRFGCSSPPLHGIVKRAPFAGLLRSALRPPPGYRVVAADFGAFEPRLIAAITGSPLLQDMANAEDLHAAMAQKFLGTADDWARTLAKKFGIALGYGQKRRTFQYKTAELDWERAGTVFDELHRLIPEVALTRMAGWRAADRFGDKQRWAVTGGGWRRLVKTSMKHFNTRVQGLAADIMRWCLRELDRDLAPLHGRLVHQAHDEIILVVPNENVQAAKELIGDVMRDGAARHSGLLPRPVPLVAKVKEGATWADVM